MILKSLILASFSLLYRLVVAVRNWFFDVGILKITKVGVPVISVGNISAGGVGKTPVVEMLTVKLKENHRVAVVSRGYKRKTKGTVVANDGKGMSASVEEIGDEPSQIAGKFPDLIVVVDERRVRGAKKAIELGAEVILLDDGFQHRYLYRDLDIVILTAGEVLLGEHLLPEGKRREPIGSLMRSDAIFVSRCLNVSDFNNAFSKLEKFNKPVIGVQTRLGSFKSMIPGRSSESVNLELKEVIAFSGIGNPASFIDLLEKAKVKVTENFIFPDHYWYSDDDIRAIVKAKKDSTAEYIVTTEKDAARLKYRHKDFFLNEQVVIAEIQLKVIAGEGELDRILNNFKN